MDFLNCGYPVKSEPGRNWELQHSESSTGTIGTGPLRLLLLAPAPSSPQPALPSPRLYSPGPHGTEEAQALGPQAGSVLDLELQERLSQGPAGVDFVSSRRLRKGLRAWCSWLWTPGLGGQPFSWRCSGAAVAGAQSSGSAIPRAATSRGNR